MSGHRRSSEILAARVKSGFQGVAVLAERFVPACQTKSMKLWRFLSRNACGNAQHR